MKLTTPSQLLLSLIMLVTGTLHASIVAVYDFSVNAANQQSNSLVTASDATAPWSSNFMGNVTSGAFRDTDNDLIQPTIAEALNGNRYVTITLTPSQDIDLTTFKVTLGGTNSASSTDYTVGIGVFSSITGFTEPAMLGDDSLFLSSGSGIIDKSTPLTIDLSSSASLQGISSSVEFRIYMLDDRATDSSAFNVRIRDISVEAVAAIPEPSTIAFMLGIAALGSILWRRKTRLK